MNIRDNQPFAKAERTYSVGGANGNSMSETTPKEQRGPTNLRIKFRSASIEQFIERYAADVSRGGIFIHTRKPRGGGPQFRPDPHLQDGMALLAGEGTVIWIRENDPARPTVPPGMAVRFDKVSDETQPTLERILAEKARLEQAGVVPAQPGSGMAVRRPSSVLAPLDSSGRVSEPATSAATARVEAGGAPATGERPAATTGTPAATKTSFLGSRTTASAGTPAPVGPFTRARQTSTRPVPVPSALFEPPTAADIDKALSVLEEAPGPAPMPSVPRFVPEDISNDPTRVADAAETAAAAEGAGEAALPSLAETGGEGELGSAGVAGGLADAAVSSPERAAVVAPATPDVSRRFRAASRAYPTLRRRPGAIVVVALIAIVGAGAAIVWKLRPGSTVPPHPVTTAAATIAPAQAPGPAPTPPPAPAAEPAAPPPSAPPPGPEAAAAPPAPEKSAAAKTGNDKTGSEEHGSSHHSARHKSHEQAAAGHAAAKETAALAADKTVEAKPVEDKPAAEKPAAAPAAEAAAPAAEAKPAGPLLKITSTPAGADVSIDGAPVGVTPFTSRDIDPGAPHAITLKKDGFETHERMVGASDWSRPHGSTPPALKVNVKLRRIAPPPAADTPKETGAPADDTGGPYIKEVNPSNP
jgi:uncharacterized protein (TIGR02266 family)